LGIEDTPAPAPSFSIAKENDRHVIDDDLLLSHVTFEASWLRFRVGFSHIDFLLFLDPNVRALDIGLTTHVM
jgi:hypothetical protein